MSEPTAPTKKEEEPTPQYGGAPTHSTVEPYGAPPAAGAGAYGAYPAPGPYGAQPAPGPYGAPPQGGPVPQAAPVYGAPGGPAGYGAPPGTNPAYGISPAGYAPGAPVGGGYAVAGVAPVTNDLFSALEALRGLFVFQKMELLEAITGCETRNKYHIYGWDPERGHEKAKHGKIKPKLFKAKEHSSCLMRQCCGNARTFQMDIKGAGKVVMDRQEDRLSLLRPFKCTCLCFCRSRMHVNYPSMPGDIAELLNPFTCCNRIVEVRRPESEGHVPAEAVRGTPPIWYRIRGKLCQPASFCHCPCSPFNKVHFYIYEPNDEGFTTPVGEITKVWDSCCRSMFTDADNFTCVFPKDANKYQKAAILSAILFLDFLYFEERNQNRNAGVGIGAGIAASN